MISLFGKPERLLEPSLLDRLKASVTKTKDALSQTVDNIFLGEKQIDPAALAETATAILSDSKVRSQMVAAGQALIDGLGAERVVAAMREEQ